ncbi:MAG: heavy metal-binding domain-containing protein [Atopobiaceae bacterium]|nr:heavy metal-binding domain-containing protein [Atopobiaceae bacterium]
MLITTCDVIPGRQLEALGLVRGNVVTSKHIGRDIMGTQEMLAYGTAVRYV